MKTVQTTNKWDWNTFNLTLLLLYGCVIEDLNLLQTDIDMHIVARKHFPSLSVNFEALKNIGEAFSCYSKIFCRTKKVL